MVPGGAQNRIPRPLHAFRGIPYLIPVILANTRASAAKRNSGRGTSGTGWTVRLMRGLFDGIRASARGFPECGENAVIERHSAI
jgi:hypothetical protein